MDLMPLYAQIPLLRPAVRPGFEQKKVADQASDFFLLKPWSQTLSKLIELGQLRRKLHRRTQDCRDS